jgi:hypothetical protein
MEEPPPARRRHAQAPHPRMPPGGSVTRSKAVLQDIASYERQQETLALLKLLALSQQDVDAGRVRPAAEVFADIRRRRDPRLGM